MDFPSPPAVIEALRQRAEHGVFGYTHAPEELYQAIMESLQRDYGWRIEREWIVWLPGLVTGLNVMCRSVGDPGDDIISLTPVYPPFLSAPALSGRKLIKVPLEEAENRWIIDFERFEEAITPHTRLFLLCNPHNPVGRVFDRGELQQLANICERRDIIICADEIHGGLVLDTDKRHIPIATLSPEIARRTVTLMAPSKTYNLPGLGCAFAIIPDQNLRSRFKSAAADIVPHVNLFGYTAAVAAYRDSQEWHRELLVYLRQNRDLLEREIGGMQGLRMAHVEGTYLAWIDTRETGITRPARFFEDAGVGLSDGVDFGGPGFVRLNFATSRQLLQTGIGRIKASLS